MGYVGLHIRFVLGGNGLQAGLILGTYRGHLHHFGLLGPILRPASIWVHIGLLGAWQISTQLFGAA